MYVQYGMYTTTYCADRNSYTDTYCADRNDYDPLNCKVLYKKHQKKKF